MANKLISEMGLPKSIANIFAARNIITAKFCLKLALLASLPAACGGLDGHVVYVDVESKFSSRRLIEIGSKSFPEVFYREGMAKEMAGRILVLQPASLAEFTDSLQQIEVSLLQNKVKLLVIDSMAALTSGESEQSNSKQHALGWHISFLKSLAELSRIPIIVTNQVRSQISDGSSLFYFQHNARYSLQGRPDSSSRLDSHLVAALGTHWAHAVSIRLILESKSGQRFIKIAKSPMSPPLEFQFKITPSGISLLCDNGVEVSGPQIHTIQSHCNSAISYLGDTTYQ